MKQLIQSINSGKLAVIDVPSPKVMSTGILVRTRASLVSAGTERMIASFAQSNLLQKARSRPDLVRQTIDKVKRDGIVDTIDAVRNRLDQPMPLGYSAAGEVIDVGHDVTEFKVGDRVACAGAGYAVHAQVISVPRNLAARIPDGISFEEASFCTVGAIALHGIRLSAPQLGEIVAVIGLGLLGQLAVQMLKAAGCKVIGTDLLADRVALAARLGAFWTGTDINEFRSRIAAASDGHGADAVLITADTASDQPVELAGEVARKGGRVVAVGAVGTHLPRKAYFEKELDFRISRSYGPGRYDPSYEEKGHDYPYEFVRWTEQRNLQAFAQMIAADAVDVEALISHRFEIENADQAYDLILGRITEPSLGVVLRYTNDPDLPQRIVISARSDKGLSAPEDVVSLGVLGAGLFANATLLPAVQGMAGIQLVGIASSGGLTARRAAERFGFSYCADSTEELLQDSRINTVAVLTRHSAHARQTEEALRAGKNVFVEKPLCLTNEELERIIAVYEGLPVPRMLTVGYNRRFAPMIVTLRNALRRTSEPLMLTCRVNAGHIPREHWTHDPSDGGGRLRGEGCHFIDLLINLANDRVRRVTTRVLPDAGRYTEDNLQITLEFHGGSVGTLVYVANGAKAFPKEAIEVFGGGIAARLDDFRELKVQAGSRATNERARFRQDKGHRGEWLAIVKHLTTGAPPPIPFEDLVHSTRATLAAFESLRDNASVEVI